MATTQVVFTTDEDLKKKALYKLRSEWATLKSLLQYSMIAYVQWKISLGIVIDEDRRTDDLEQDYRQKSEDFEQWHNMVEWDDLVTKYTA